MEEITPQVPSLDAPFPIFISFVCFVRYEKIKYFVCFLAYSECFTDCFTKFLVGFKKILPSVIKVQ